MACNLVKIGDIIRLNKGMTVITRAPVWIFNKDKPFSKEYCETVVEIGQIYQRSSYSKNKIMEMIQSFFNSEFNATLEEEHLSSIVDKLKIDYHAKNFDTSFLEGEYVVSDARYLMKRIAPYQVTCYKKNNSEIKIVFYQDCSVYKANIKEIEVIGNVNEH